MPTIYEIGKTIRQVEEGRASKSAVSIVSGLKPKPFDVRPGQRRLSTEQILSLEVPTLARSNGGFKGFQRPELPLHARRIAVALLMGVPMPAVEVALLPDGTPWLVDGQHRALGAVIAGMPLTAIIRRFTEDEARALFTNQSRARRVNPNVVVLSADDPFSEYVQDACTSSEHVWGRLVGQVASANRISPKQMHHAIVSYSVGSINAGGRPVSSEGFDARFCDEMGVLLGAFGTKQTNPLAFRPTGVRAIVDAAILVVRRAGSQQETIDRWVRHMPVFPFASYQHIRRIPDVTDALLAHWNKRLSAANKVAR